MPRPSRVRSIEGEANLARRIQHERTARGLSYEGLAKLMSDAGCKTQGSAIFKIEKGTPPRRVTVDELIALAEVFDVGVENLLTPMRVLETHLLKELLARLDAGDRNLIEAATTLINAYVEYFELAAFEPEMQAYIDGHRFAEQVAHDIAANQPPPLLKIDGSDVDVDPSAFMEGLKAFYLGIVQQASEVAKLTVKENQRRGIGRSPIAEGE